MPDAQILFVDDDRLILATLAKHLRDTGYRVVTADSGEDALEQAASEHFDLAVVDMRMPGMSGCETAKHLRDRHGIMVLFLSAYSDREMVQQAVAEGGMGYILKPIDIPQLVPAIETALARARDFSMLQKTRIRLERAQLSNRVTATAVGIMMARRKLNEQAAFKALCEATRKRKITIEDYSHELVAALERLNDQ